MVAFLVAYWPHEWFFTRKNKKLLSNMTIDKVSKYKAIRKNLVNADFFY